MPFCVMVIPTAIVVKRSKVATNSVSAKPRSPIKYLFGLPDFSETLLDATFDLPVTK